MRDENKHADGSEWFDLDTSQNEEAQVLQPDKTWQHCSGDRYQIRAVPFMGRPEVIAAELQKLRDDVQWGTHAVVHHAKVGTRTGAPGEIVLYIQLRLTNLPRNRVEPLERLDRMVLRIIANVLLQTAMNIEQVLADIISKQMTAAVRDEEDTAFLRIVEAAIKAVRMDKT